MPEPSITRLIQAVDDVSLALDVAQRTAAEATAALAPTLAENARLTSDNTFLRAEWDRLNGNVSALSAINRDQAERITQQDGTIAQLRARIAELEGEEPDPEPGGVDTWLGATINTKAGQTYAQAFTDWETKRGRIGILRTFNSGAPGTFALCNGAAQMAGRHRIISVKGSLTAAYWDRLIASIPHDKVTGSQEDCITGLVWQHEPENDGGTMTPARYRAGNDLMQQRIAASGRTDVIAGFVLMSWLEQDNNPDTSSDDWFPTEPSEFFLFLDPYDPNNVKTGRVQTEATLALFRAKGGAWWGITETGSHRTGADLARWINEYVAWCHAEKASFFTWFHSAVGTNAGPNGWWLDDPQGIAAWKALAPVIRG